MNPGDSSASPSGTHTILGAWYRYYEDYFTSEGTCKARGDYMKANINGIRAYRCYKINDWSTKWSMDVYDDYA